jgi:hypothetical protein
VAIERDVALGFRVKSGFAVAVVVSGPASAPIAIARGIVQLSDPGIEATRQPYHDGFGTAQEDPKVIARLTRLVHRAAKNSVSALMCDPLVEGRRCRGAGLVVGSVIDPATVGNPHIRAHASEGRLFRTALAEALEERHLRCTVIVEKALDAQSRKALGRSQGQIRKSIATLGATLGGPWRAEEKAAALAAWMLLGQ